MAAERVCLLPIEGSGGKDMVKADLWHESHSRFKVFVIKGKWTE